MSRGHVRRKFDRFGKPLDSSIKPLRVGSHGGASRSIFKEQEVSWSQNKIAAGLIGIYSWRIIAPTF